MFYGPPGTGKSSLCFAAAGSLHLKIYLISLNSKTLTEDGLASLFQSLPRRCIVLLEDVDAAGMTNKRGENAVSDAPTQQATATSSAKPGDDKPKNDNNKTPQGISLSALLNIIDGVASSEGRILVMTTNHIEQLDPALLRPGRVDMTIAFGLSDSVTIKDLFLSIYAPIEGDLPRARTARVANGSTDKKDHQANPSGLRSRSRGASSSSTPSQSQISRLDDSSRIEIVAQAEQFAEHIPNGEFTPAEIQGYLLRHKKEPEVAIAGAEAWVHEEKARKAAHYSTQTVSTTKN
jgi:chaperone BCS1